MVAAEPEVVALARPLTLPTAPKDPASSYIARLAKASRKTQTFAVRKIVEVMGGGDPRIFPWAQITYEHSREFLVRMESSGLAFTTVNRHIAALRGVLQEAWRMRMMTAEQYMQAIDPLKPIRGSRLPKGRQISVAELDAFLSACSPEKDASAYGVRDLAMFTLMCLGLRRHEVVGALLKDYDRSPNGGVLTVIGKGNKERAVPLSPNAAAFIDAWLAVRPPEPANPFVLTSPRDGKPLSPQAVGAMLVKRAKEANIDEKSLASHDFRRTFISSLLAAGVDISVIQKIVGHSDTNTTARYDRRGIDAGRAAIEKIGWGKK